MGDTNDYILRKEQEARELFLNNYNCCQAVCKAFAHDFGVDEVLITKLATSFGGGFGRQRLVCGAVSGATMMMGLLYPEEHDNKESKKINYAKEQEFCQRFAQETGSIICSELLNLQKGVHNDPQPEARTKAYYAKRPCKELVGLSARIVAEMIVNKKLHEDNNH